MLVGCDVDFGEEVAAPDLSDIAASVLRDEVPAQTHALGTATERTGLALQDAKAELFPPFLREDPQEASNPAFRAMQEMKMRAVEHVRWRSANCNTSDPYFACLLTQMRSDVRGFLKEGERRVTTLRFLESITVNKLEEPQLFLLDAHSQALKITEFTQAPRVIGCVRVGVDVIVITAALVITPPRRGSSNGTRLKTWTLTWRAPFE